MACSMMDPICGANYGVLVTITYWWQVAMVCWAPYMGESGYGVLGTIYGAKWLWCVRHHVWGQVAIVCWSPYSEASGYGASDTICGANWLSSYGVLVTILWGKWLWCIRHHTWGPSSYCVWRQVAMACWVPYSRACGYGKSGTISGDKWLWCFRHHIWSKGLFMINHIVTNKPYCVCHSHSSIYISSIRLIVSLFQIEMNTLVYKIALSCVI